MTNPPRESPRTVFAGDEVPELELSDADILDAMQHIPGYLDITTEDFRAIYHLAHRHAMARLFGDLSAKKRMRTGIVPLLPDMPLAVAARAIVRSGYKALPVVDAAGNVIGMLTETDFLRRLKVDTCLELLLNMLDNDFEFTHYCHETPVREAMSASVVSVREEAGSLEIISAFRQHEGRSMPVVDNDGRLLGLLLRKDFFSARNLENSR